MQFVTIIKCQTHRLEDRILLNTMYPKQLVPPKSSCFISPFPTLFYFLAPFFLHPSQFYLFSAINFTHYCLPCFFHPPFPTPLHPCLISSIPIVPVFPEFLSICLRSIQEYRGIALRMQCAQCFDTQDIKFYRSSETVTVIQH